jgi:hypothetical protein
LEWWCHLRHVFDSPESSVYLQRTEEQAAMAAWSFHRTARMEYLDVDCRLYLVARMQHWKPAAEDTKILKVSMVLIQTVYPEMVVGMG